MRPKKDVEDLRVLRTYRLDKTTISRLEEMAKAWHMTNTDLLETLVNGEYLKFKDINQKEIDKLVNQLNDINLTIKGLSTNINK
jgi:hypothetical protein